MMKSLAFASLASIALAACASEPEPQPDPALVERLADTAAPRAPELAKAERLAAAADRTDPDRLAGPAERLLAR